MSILKSDRTKLGNKIELIGENEENNVLIIGVFHGDEPQGKYLIEKYLDRYSPSPLTLSPLGRGLRRGDAIFIPCLNPDGLQLGKRTNANGVDLNRNFPTQNWGEDTSLAGDNPQDYYITSQEDENTMRINDFVKRFFGVEGKDLYIGKTPILNNY